MGGERDTRRITWQEAKKGKEKKREKKDVRKKK